MNMRHHTAEQDCSEAVGQEIARAEQDFERLRSAYLALVQSEPDSEVAISMVGADLDRAHAALQLLTGQRQLPLMTKNTAAAIRISSRRMAEVDS